MTAPVKLFGAKLEIAIKATFDTSNNGSMFNHTHIIESRQIEYISHSEFRLMFHHVVKAIVADIMTEVTENYGNVGTDLSKAINTAVDEIVYYFTVDTTVDMQPDEWLSFGSLSIYMKNVV